MAEQITLERDDVIEALRDVYDPEIPVKEVNQTCERCPLDENQCLVRTAPHNVYTREKEEKLLNQRLEKLVTENRNKNLQI